MIMMILRFVGLIHFIFNKPKNSKLNSSSFFIYRFYILQSVTVPKFPLYKNKWRFNYDENIIIYANLCIVTIKKKDNPLSSWQRQAERLFNIMTHYRAALAFEWWICAAVPIMPHYVNIAWGIIFWPCLFVCRVGAALCFLTFSL